MGRFAELYPLDTPENRGSERVRPRPRLHEMEVRSPDFSLADYQADPWGPGNVSIRGPRNADAREWRRKTQVAVIAFSSLARAFFSGRITCKLYERQKNEELSPMILFRRQKSEPDSFLPEPYAF